MPRRYSNYERTYFGKTVEEFTESDIAAFLAETDALLNKTQTPHSQERKDDNYDK